MEEEMIPKKKNDDEINEEVIEKEKVNEYQEPKEKGRVGRIISRIIWTLIVLFVLF